MSLRARHGNHLNDSAGTPHTCAPDRSGQSVNELTLPRADALHFPYRVEDLPPHGGSGDIPEFDQVELARHGMKPRSSAILIDGQLRRAPDVYVLHLPPQSLSRDWPAYQSAPQRGSRLDGASRGRGKDILQLVHEGTAGGGPGYRDATSIVRIALAICKVELSKPIERAGDYRPGHTQALCQASYGMGPLSR
jgi:hypothetical protein